jgi:hypothetical protein
LTREFIACKQKVHNRGRPPESFLHELVDWGTTAPESIFLRNDKFDIYSSVVRELGPWQHDTHRRAAMLEVLRVLGGFESSWDWDAGRDTTNPRERRKLSVIYRDDEARPQIRHRVLRPPDSIHHQAPRANQAQAHQPMAPPRRRPGISGLSHVSQQTLTPSIGSAKQVMLPLS